ncbi:Maltooligosyl trehalose synthase [Streptomyces sp. YIM 130001]|uniref:malto-oligosyltrehalose synthase n=1 Tax=Streptomyces sp. YIM 130001 TaxID=2259644 RepID=UPI000E651F43|nr:malto-oligosyltrehalose synthase [Streptomyces sp. YIM 130001]RII17659.1 Maltooligosyl trehalose synthase [Streptomyces sp. YIM 130001]
MSPVPPSSPADPTATPVRPTPAGRADAAHVPALADPPAATYRLQLQPRFPFAAAEAAVPRLAALGVSHLHLSPILESVPGSTHGYDVVDHARVRAEIGGEEGLRALSATARAHGLGLIVDIVPNHMAALPDTNHALWEVLREGPQSPYARWFDIDWDLHDGVLLLPVLPHRREAELDVFRVDGRVLRHGQQSFPLRPGTEERPLEALLDEQWYRLAWWRLARTDLNYRRFFTISDLIAVRVEDPEVFEATHRTVLRLLGSGVVDGLRIDHPDGLTDPGAYLEALHGAGGGCWTVVEKILADGERLPQAWPVAGTTGYDALRHIDGLFVDPVGAEELLALYRRFARPADDLGGDWRQTVRRAARQVVTHELAAEVDRLVRSAASCAAAAGHPDHAPWALRTALQELLVRVPVYRPYGTGEAAGAVLRAQDAQEAREAFAVAEEARAVDVVRALLIGTEGGDGPELRAFRARFAQTSSALRAKAVEDTACYRHVPLLSACEVGGDPGRPALPPTDFHAYCARMQRDWPDSGTVLSTHDTKRSADVRAAIAVLTECPGRWAELLDRVGRARDGRSAASAGAVDPQLVWAAWQTAFGLGPATDGRLRDALLKHAREAGLHTTWTEPDAAYEDAVREFADAGPGSPAGIDAVAELAGTLGPHILANVLGGTLLHLTMPGVPDLYQGSERHHRVLVDPDNRRPVTFPAAGRSGADSEGTGADDPDDPVGALVDAHKLAVTRAALRLRRDDPAAFAGSGSYRALAARGPAAERCVAFTRSERVVSAVTRLSLRLAEDGGWQDTELPLPEGTFVDAIALRARGESRREAADGPTAAVREFRGHARVADLFADRPVALLVRR